MDLSQGCLHPQIMHKKSHSLLDATHGRFGLLLYIFRVAVYLSQSTLSFNRLSNLTIPSISPSHPPSSQASAACAYPRPSQRLPPPHPNTPQHPSRRPHHPTSLKIKLAPPRVQSAFPRPHFNPRRASSSASHQPHRSPAQALPRRGQALRQPRQSHRLPRGVTACAGAARTMAGVVIKASVPVDCRFFSNSLAFCVFFCRLLLLCNTCFVTKDE